MFTYINVKYQSLFNSTQFIADENGEPIDIDIKEKERILDQNLQEFSTFTKLGQITSFSCLMSVIGQFIFNGFSKEKFPFDKWSILDFANAITNTICFGMFIPLTANDLMNETTKELYNWIQVLAILVSWARFLSLFLVIQSISILIITLF